MLVKKLMKFKLASSMFTYATFLGTSTAGLHRLTNHLSINKTNASSCAYNQNASSTQYSLGHPHLITGLYKKYFPIKRIPLAYGGFKEVFDIAGKFTYVLVTPKNFNALTAPDQELELYGIPDRPNNESDLKKWIENWQDYHGGSVPYMVGASITQTNTGLSESTASNPVQDQNSQLSQQPSNLQNSISTTARNNWGGYIVDGPGAMGYVSADMQMPNIAKNPDECPGYVWAASEWVGIGGATFPYSFMQVGEVQVEKSYLNESPIQGPFYEYFDPTDSGEIVFPCMYYRLADWWNFSVEFNSEFGGTYYLTAHDLSEPRSHATLVNPVQNGACPLTSPNGKQRLFSDITIAVTNMKAAFPTGKNTPGEWIIEQPALNGSTLYALGNFQTAQVKNAEAGYYKNATGSGSTRQISNFKRGPISIYGCYTGTEGIAGGCTPWEIDGGLATQVIPTPAKQGFDVQWLNCGGELGQRFGLEGKWSFHK